MKVRLSILSFFCWLMSSCFLVPIHAQSSDFFYPTLPPWTPDAAMSWLYDAHDYLLKTGDLSEFQKKDGKFTKGKMFDYRFVLVTDCEMDTVYAHPFIPHLVGVKGLLTKQKDARGMLHHRVNCQMAEKYPNGVWVESYQVVPFTKISAPLIAFIIKIKGTSIAISVLTREINLSESELNKRTRKWLHQRWKQKNKRLIAKIEQTKPRAVQLARKAVKAKK